MDLILQTAFNLLIAHPTLPLWVLLLSVLFWLLFATAAGLYWKRLKYDKTEWQWWAISLLGYPIALFTFVYDVIFQHTVACLLFWGPPRQRKTGKGLSKWEWTLTSRLKRLLKQDKGWRRKLALFTCTKLVEPSDPNHCGLQNRTGVFAS